MKIIAVIILGIVGLGIFFILKYRKSKSELYEIEKIKINELTLKKVVEYFKTKNLNPNTHVPFISKNTKDFIFSETEMSKKILVLGIFNKEKNDFKPFIAFICESLSEDIKELLGNEELVVLS